MTTHLKSLLIVLLVSLASKHFVSADVFLSIDCGSCESYKDENGIEWTGDGGYIQNGVTKTVEFTGLVPHQMSTLRVFSTRKKNCYTIGVDEGERILVRASFYYGNYDGKSSPPVFDLLFDGNFWATIQTSTYDVLSEEVIYVVKANSTSICVAQTQPGQLPFISALEVRSLDSKMYSQVATSLALFLVERIAYGTNETIIRYPDDAYDRIWKGGRGIGLDDATSSALTINGKTAYNNPPEAVLKNAVTASSTNVAIGLYTGLSAKPTPIYMAAYFSEVLLLNNTQIRSFQLWIDNYPVSDPVVPPYGSAAKIYITNRNASWNNSFLLQATDDSTLPPLVNAMELYTLSQPLINKTNIRDVEGIALLQNVFEELQGWSGDPCLPFPYTLDWVECNADSIPRVIALNLSGFGLSGALPDFSSMDALQSIDLSNNNLIASIPDFLGTFSNLTILNLANNRFNGIIPNSLSSNNKLKLVVTGNCLSGMSCPPPSPPPPSTAPSSTWTDCGKVNFSSHSKSSNKLAVILGALIQFSLLFCLPFQLF